MLLEFRTTNYKSFKDEMVFSMIPAPKQKGLDYSILHKMAGKKEYKGLCSAVIYGPNASGKTNIIGAMETFKNIILRGNIRNTVGQNEPNAAANALELIPNNTNFEVEPVSFGIKFITEGFLIDYSLLLDLGKFLDDEYSRKILSEELLINQSLIFSRYEELEFGDFELYGDLMVNAFKQNSDSAKELAMNNLNSEELFLMNGFKSMFSSKIVEMICNWLNNKFMVVYRADALQLVRKFSDPKKKSAYVERTLNKAAKYFGINSNAIGYVVDGDDTEARLCSIFDIDEKNSTAIPAEIFESYGTIRFINLFPLVVRALMTGSTLIVDEFDASVHPMALMNIINIFHNDDINTKKAQLIFNTHNPIFLNSNLYRRDEIKFVERDEETHYSEHYSLSDFGTSGTVSVRQNQDYMKNYFINRYGAIKDIDFSPIFEELVVRGKED